MAAFAPNFPVDVYEKRLKPEVNTCSKDTFWRGLAAAPLLRDNLTDVGRIKVGGDISKGKAHMSFKMPEQKGLHARQFVNKLSQR